MNSVLGLLGLLLAAEPTATSTVSAPEVVVGAPLPVEEDGGVQRVDPPDMGGPVESPPPTRALLWVPQVLLAPVYAVNEYVIRRPVGWLVTTAERERWPTFFIDLFTFGEERKVGLVPTAIFDFGFRPSFGFYFFANDAWIKGHELRLRAAFGGPDWYQLAFTERWRTWTGGQLEYGFSFLDRPDWQFNGLGPDTLNEVRARFGRRIVAGHVAHRQRFLEHAHFEARLTVEENSFDLRRTVFGDPSVADAVALGILDQPSGAEGYFVLKAGGEFNIDTRKELRRNGTGVSARLRSEVAVDLNDPGRRAWMVNGGGFAGHLDVGRNRILSLAGVASHAARFGRVDIPFVELPLSGRALYSLGGFRPGRLVGESLATVTLEWRWEVWALMDGRLFAQVGNVFGTDFEGFGLERTRLSYGLGMASIFDPESSFNVLFAVAHQTFDQGADPEAFRFLIGFQPDL
ncbi:MAG: hypothetical protein AAF851_01950 [Myxococcota bacterium]